MAFSSEGYLKYLQFDPTDVPPWRNRLDKEQRETTPTISKMVSDIFDYYTRWNKVKETKPRDLQEQVESKLLMKFLWNVQVEEDIGVKDEGKTKEVIYKRKDAEKETGRPSLKRFKSTDQDDGIANRDLTYTRAEFKPPHLSAIPSPGDMEECISYFHKTFSETHKLEKSEKETLNLYRGHTHLAKQVDAYNDSEKSMFLMDVDISIIETHEKLMDNIIEKDKTPEENKTQGKSKTPPGKFSTNERLAEFRGETFTYPRFVSTDAANAAVQRLVDAYNGMVDCIKHRPEKEQLSLSFRCASVFLFGFLILHPFGDGNGRLARLLSSHCLRVFCPFLTPIYNVFSRSTKEDYVDALVSARQDLNLLQEIGTENASDAVNTIIEEASPRDLCALIIESAWYMWRKFLKEMGEDIALC